MQAENLRNRVNHIQSHLDATVGVVGTWLWQSGDAVVAVAQDFNPQAVIILQIKVDSSVGVLKMRV
jgi:peptidyl-tRNA hydrolase